MGPDVEILNWIASHREGSAVVVTPPLSTIRHLRYAPTIRRLVKEVDPTAVHLNKTEVAGLRYIELLCRLLGRRVVSVVHHVEPPVTTVARLLTRALALRAESVVAVSEATAIELGGILGLESSPIVVIPNAVESSTMEHRPNPDRFTVGVLSRFVAHKCIDHILEAAAKVPDVHLIIGGSGPTEHSLLALTERLGLEDRTEFVGWVDPDEVLSRSDVVALASRIEGHPLTLLDAQARGIPVVATDVGGVAEIVDDGETGYVLPYGDIDAMAAAFDRLVHDPELMEKLGSAARHRSESGYGPNDMAASYLRLYWPCP